MYWVAFWLTKEGVLENIPTRKRKLLQILEMFVVKGTSRMFYKLYLHFIDTTMSTYMLLEVISTSYII